MPKFTVRLYGMVECAVEADCIENVMDIVCDLNQFDINKLPHQITEIDDVVEIEEI